MDSLSSENLVLVTYRVLNGYFTIRHGGKELKVLDLRCWQSAYLQEQFNKDLKEGLDSGLANDKEALRLAIKRGEWQKDWNIETIEKQIKFLNDGIKVNKFKDNIVGNLIKQRNQKVEELNKLKSIHNSIMTKGTARYYALKSMIVGRVNFCVPDANFFSENDYYAINSKIEDNSISMKTIRKTARSGSWIIKYRAAKDGIGTLLPNLNDITVHQENLISWTQIYESVHNSMNPPSHAIVENDEEFDAWLEKEHSTREFERNRKNKKHDHKEVFIATDKAGANKVWGMNDKNVRKAVQNRIVKTAQKGKAHESELL